MAARLGLAACRESQLWASLASKEAAIGGRGNPALSLWPGTPGVNPHSQSSWKALDEIPSRLAIAEPEERAEDRHDGEADGERDPVAKRQPGELDRLLSLPGLGNGLGRRHGRSG